MSINELELSVTEKEFEEYTKYYDQGKYLFAFSRPWVIIEMHNEPNMEDLNKRDYTVTLRVAKYYDYNRGSSQYSEKW